jgi:hypothetical protein
MEQDHRVHPNFTLSPVHPLHEDEIDILVRFSKKKLDVSYTTHMETTFLTTTLSMSEQVMATLSSVAQDMNMSAAEAERFLSAPVPRTIAALPFLANCEDPERTSYAHLVIYVGASLRKNGRKIFDHKPSDDNDALKRLSSISVF